MKTTQPLYSVKSGISQTVKHLCRQCADHTAGIAACQPLSTQTWFPCVISAIPITTGKCEMCEYRTAAYKLHDRLGISK